MAPLALRHAARQSAVGAALLCVLLIQGCAPYESRHQNQWNSREQIWLSETSQLKVRAAQTRVFDTTDRRRMFEAIISTMQDLDFTVEVLDEELGIISGKKFIEIEQPYGTDPSYLLYRPDTLLLLTRNFHSWGPFQHRSNLVRFTASGTSWSSSLGGATTFSDSVTVIRSTVMAVAPGITTQPANATVAAPATATLAVAASGSPSPSYQWSSAPSGSSTFTMISGATSASYTTPATSIGMSGTQYRCMATNSAGSATSNVAALTVNAGTAGTVATSVTAGGGSRDCGLGSGVVLLTLALAVGLCGRRTRL